MTRERAADNRWGIRKSPVISEKSKQVETVITVWER